MFPSHDIQNIANFLEEPVEKISFTMQTFVNPISLNTPIDNSEDMTLEDIISNSQDSVETELINSMTAEKLLSFLNPREADVIKLRHGIENGNSKTLQEIGYQYNLTRERVRQIELKAYQKIRKKYYYKNES